MFNRLAIVLITIVICMFSAGAFAAVGRTGGQFAVSAAGSAQYAIPIWTPPGIRGIQPALALAYDSQNGDGLLGVGWGLSGLSAISRCNMTYAQDTVVGSPQLTSSDRFCLDGNRLRTTNGSTYGAAGATYQTEIANFSNVVSNGTAGTGPAWFKVQGKNGLTYEYGNTTDSAILAAGTTSVRVWALNAVRDRNGNAMTFTYTNDTSNGSYRPASIQYTYTGSSGSNNGYSVTFAYQSRPSSDQQWQYAVGGANNQLNYLNQITVLSGTTMVHGYTLNYVTAPTTSRLRISTIQECASSFTDCYPATSVGYQDGQTGWGAEIANSGDATNMGSALPIDLNGDGIDDLMYADPGGHWYYELGTSAGTYSGPYDSGIANTNYQSALAIDFYANGTKNVLVPNSSGNWRVLKFVSAGAAFTYVDTTTSAAGIVPGSAMVGDVDGDGREDLIYAVSGGTGYKSADYIYYRLNTGGAFSTTQGTLASFPNGTGCAPCVKLGNTQPFGNPGYRFTAQLRKLDFNGDGRDDFIVYLGSCSADVPSNCGTSSPITYSWTVFLSQPNGTYVGADAVTFTVGMTPNQPPLVGDFDGDGCSDIAYSNGNVWLLRLGTCGRAGTTNVLGAAVSTGISFSSTRVLAIDWDGDGRTDLVGSNSASNWAVARSSGNTLNALVDTGISTEGTLTAQVADVNGDGLGDMIYPIATTALKTRLHSGVWPDLATSFTDAYGVSASPTYVSITVQSNYTALNDQVFPYQNYLKPLYVVNVAKMTDASNAPAGTYSLNYNYTGAAVNLQGRGFAGFSTVQSHDPRNGVWETRGYSRAFPTTGMLSSDLQDLDNLAAHAIYKSTSTLTYSTLDSTANNQRYFQYPSSTSENFYEVAGAMIYQLITTKATSYSFDAYGNATNITSNVTDQDSASPYYGDVWNSATVSTIAPDASSNWCLNLPTQTTVTNSNNASGGTAITRTVGYTPDYSECRETVKVTEPNSAAYKVTETYGFDSFGNINSRAKTGVGMATRTTSINWGASGQFPTTVTNPLSQSITLGYDSNTGMLTSMKDPNALTTSWQYDSFARKIQEMRPDKTSTTWAYNDCATAGCVNTNNKMTLVQTRLNIDGTTQRIDNTYLDVLDRTLIGSGEMQTGAFNRVEVQYDSLGHIHLQGAPCMFTSCTQYWTTNSYDVLNRLTQSQRPISATNANPQTTLYGYQGRTLTITDPQSKLTKRISYVTGAIARTIDHNGYYVNSIRDAFGAATSVTDSLSNTLSTTTYQYGIAPFVVSSTDMDSGTWSYTVDALGEVAGYTDAKGQNFSIIYDALSRPTQRTEPDLTTTWTWGNTAASYNIGKLQSVSSVSSGGTYTVSSVSSGGTYTDAYTFDNKGRLSNRTITLPTVGAEAFDYTYDATYGTLAFVKFPVSYPSTYRLTARYQWQNGIPQAIRDGAAPTTTWWQNNSSNAAGQITQETTTDLSGDPQIVSRRTYDAVTHWVTSIQTGVSSGSALQNESYLYDLVGNVTQRQNNNAGLTENFYYDNLYRLDHSVLGGTTNLQMAYDAMGNITSRSDIAAGAAWTYDPTHKHEVTQAGNAGFTYSYDANGNAQTRNGTALTWTSYNYPSEVATATESASFDYGPDRQRWRMKYLSATGMETTYYATPAFEQVATSTGTEFRHYLYAAGRPVVLISRNSAGAVNVRSLLTDHEGSVSTVVSDSTGASYTKESFTAYGNRRDANTWSGAPTSADRTTMDGVTREGYTFQTVLGSMGLNHMNGRVQDAVTGRFLSADPYVSDPSNTQSYNRYSYVNNNPLSATDPTGFTQATQPYCGGGWKQGERHPPSWGDCSSTVNGFPGGTIGNSVVGTDVDFTGGFTSGFGSSFGSSGGGNGGSGSGGSGAGGSGATGASGSQSSPDAAGVAAQSQTCSTCGTVWGDSNGGYSDVLAGVTVTAFSAAAPAFFLSGSTMFFAPAGTNFQALRQLGRQFAAQGLSAKALGAQIVNNPAINLQIVSRDQGLGYGSYQDAANFAVGVVSEGFFGGSDIGWVEMSAGGQWYGLTHSSDWSLAMPGYWQGWWNAGWNAASSGNYPVQVGAPLQMSYPLQ